ncbi:MAG: hypothetical protein ABI446_10435 [Gemmatimonadaceae bacterium]
MPHRPHTCIPSGSIDAGPTSLTFQPTPAALKGLRIVDAPSGSSRRLRALLAARRLGKRLQLPEGLSLSCRW